MANTKKPWSGRFEKPTAKNVEIFTASISYDKRLYPYDIAGSIAHAKMLADQGIIGKSDAQKIIRSLKSIVKDMDQGKIDFNAADEDVHMAIERVLINRIGEVGGKLHTARSRNDQIVLDEKLFLRSEVVNICSAVTDLKSRLLVLARNQINTIMPGYTHMQKAQPVLLSHYLLAFWEMFNRDAERLRDCEKRFNILPLGASALAGTSLPIDRQKTANMLKFPKISENSMDTVADRDFIAEFIFSLSLIMMHLSRFCEDMILWSSSEFAFIEISDAYTTGSSIMPQKKNPDIAELIRGKTGRVYGDLMAVLTLLKGLPMTYNRDLQEDKEPLFDAVDTVKNCLTIFTEMIGQTKFDSGRMHAAAEGGLSMATDLAEYLVLKGMPFRKAHEVVGKIVAYCLKRGKTLHQLTLNEYRKFSANFSADILQSINLEKSVNSRRHQGGTARTAVLKRIRDIEESVAAK
jgi:argininosuccinate lyase